MTPRCETSRFPAWIFPPLCFHSSGPRPSPRPLVYSLLPIRTVAEARRGQEAMLQYRTACCGALIGAAPLAPLPDPSPGGGRDGMCSSRRWDPGQHSPSRGLIDTPIWTKLPASSESNAHDGCRARLRRRYDGQRETAQELRLAASESARKDLRVCGNLPRSETTPSFSLSWKGVG